ncbi:MAG: Uma2 family endonuclease [Sporichthyaceae bacterium]
MELLVHAIRAQDGPWTEESFAALPESNRRIELLDGQLLMSPSPAAAHQRLSLRIAAVLDRVCPPEWVVLQGVDVRVESGRIFVPDIAVVRAPFRDIQVWDAAEVGLALEIVSPGSRTMDRSIKPRLYAGSGIPVYVRVESAEVPSAIVGRLAGDRYVAGDPGPVLRLLEPFPADIDLPALLPPPS